MPQTVLVPIEMTIAAIQKIIKSVYCAINSKIIEEWSRENNVENEMVNFGRHCFFGSQCLNEKKV